MYSVVPSNDVSAVSASDGSSGAFISGLSGFASDLELSMNKAFFFHFSIFEYFLKKLEHFEKSTKMAKFGLKTCSDFSSNHFSGRLLGIIPITSLCTAIVTMDNGQHFS